MGSNEHQQALPSIAAYPCPACGQEAILQATVMTDMTGGGIQVRGAVVRQCGCEPPARQGATPAGP